MPARDRRPIRREPVPPASRPAAPSPDRRAADQRQWEPVTADPPRPAPHRADHQAPEPRFASTAATSTVLTRALLPLRIFVGATFLYAGIDKIINPLFLRASGPGSIGEQLAAFERVSPIAPLVHLADPIPVLVGLLIALVEIAIGLGALLGLLFRWAAVGGAVLSLIFFLTASWSTHPYYYGPDLPYMFGWITLALAGHGHLFTLEDWLAEREAAAAAASAWSPRGGAAVRRGSTTPPMFTDQERRAFLQLGILTVASIAVASLTGMWGLRERAEGGGEALASTTPSGGVAGASPSAAAVASAGASVAPSPAASAAGAGSAASANLIGTLTDLKSQGALSFQDPSTGDPGIVVNAGGKVVAYDAICTHQGCQVEYDPSQSLLVCPCHGAEFDPAKGAAVVAGPAPTPLASFPITVDSSTGRIYLKA